MMPCYRAPIRDMLFTMKEIAGLESLSGAEEFDAALVEAILDEAGRFASGVLAPINAIGDRQGCAWQAGEVRTADGFREAYAAFCENGWHAMPAAPAYGGQGLPTLVSTAVLEMWKSANMAFSLCQMLTLGAVEAIAHHADDELKQRYLPNMVSGRWTGTMNLTEPQAGSDLSAIRSKAIADGENPNRYRISGTKIFITWGEHDLAENIVHLVLARLPEAPEGVKGISLFVVPKYLVQDDGRLGARNDLSCASIEHKLGIHGSATAVMAFGEKEGAIGYLVGEANRGLEYMFTMMNHARLNVGLEGVAISERAYQQALAYARERVQGRPIGERAPGKKEIIHHPDVRRMLLDMKSRIEAMRSLAYYTAGQMDRARGDDSAEVRAAAQARVDFLTPVVKGWCTESAVGITSTGIQVHGGMGFIEETGAAQHLRDARITTIYEGTTGIQANDLIGRKLAREKAATARALVEEMSSLRAALVSSGRPELMQLASPLKRAITALVEAVDWMLVKYDAEPRAAAAGAVPFLKLTGTVIGGWLMARAALVARERLAVDDGAADLYRSKLITARYFAEHVLPEASAMRDAIVNGAEPVLALDEALF
jgi:alkylation response protein AidB-like acyl-CoA dehydrogenase